MPSLREMIKKLLFPYENILSIAVISDEEQNCPLLKEVLYSAFVADNTTLNQIANLSYSKENDIFSFIVNNETEIKFSLHEKVIDLNSVETIYQTYDVLIPVLRLNKYAAHEYSLTVHATDTILSSITSTNKPAVFAYLNTEYIFEEKIESETQWQIMNNELHKRIIDNTVESEIKLTEQGNAVIQGLFKVFNYHSKEQRLFGIPQKANFFASENSDSGIVYGKNEFATNLLMQLLSFDKLNTFYFQIN
jgi:hypothetical protein